MAEENKNIEDLLSDENNLQKAIDVIKSKNFVVKPNEEYSKMDETIRKEIGKHFGEQLSTIDRSLSEHLGIEKEGNEKTADFIKRVVPSLKEKLNTLESERDKGLTGADSLKAERDSLLEKLNLAQKEKTELEDGFKTTLTNKEKEHLVNKSISKLDFKDGIDTVLGPAKKQFIEEMLSNSILEDGKLIFKDSEGVTKRNDKNEPITVLELASKQFESVLNTTSKKEGLGTKDNNGKSSTLLNFAASRKPTNFGECEATLKAYYAQKGGKLINGSKEYQKGISELRKAFNA
jgi:hypothetical protein